MRLVQRSKSRRVMSLAALVLGATGPALAARGWHPADGRRAPRAISSAGAPAATTYDVYGVRFAGFHGYPVSDLVLGADTSRRADLAFIVWVLKPTAGGDRPTDRARVVLFDAGFYRDKFIAQWKPVDFVRPSEAIDRVGVRPADVTDIIISHIHWDHVDGADLFPRARVWLQRAEYEHYVGADGSPRARGIDTVDAQMLARLRRAGRIGLIPGDSQVVIPGITAYTGGRHTYASEYIAVQTSHGTVVLASDNVYMYENLTKHVPIAATYTRADSASNRAAQDRMKLMVADPRFVLPGHDPAIFTRFPTPGNGVALIE
jgi:glyoxylase-like metal-dependent hydrolase (beta-lactamase superfamily II)